MFTHLTTRPARATSALLGLGLVLTAASVAPGEAHSSEGRPDRSAVQPSSRTTGASTATRLVAPGRIGKARIGMTVDEAMATGQFNQNVVDPLCDPDHTIYLQPKKPFKRQYVVFVADDEIVEMNAGGDRMRTAKDVRTDSTYRKVKRAYGDKLTRPREVGYQQWGVFLPKGRKGPERRWIGFLFGEALVADGRLRGRDTVTLMGVTKGKRPPLMLDGC